MKNINRIISITMALGLLGSTSVLAEIPKASVVIGGRSYELTYVNDKTNSKEILNALKHSKDDVILVKLEDGNWYNNMTKGKVDPKILPMSLYKDSSGKLRAYDMQDGQELSKEELEFKVNNIIISSKEELIIDFAYPIASHSIKVKIDGEEIPKESLKVSDNGYSIKAKLNKTLPKEDFIQTITLEGEVKSVFGEKLDEEITRKLLVINGSTDNSKMKEFEGDVSIIASNRKVNGLKVDGNINLLGNKCYLENSTAKGTINVDSGSSGEVTIKKVNAGKINVKSGSGNGIQLNEVTSKKLIVSSNTKVVLEGKSKVDSTIIESESILNNKSGDFGNIVIEDLRDNNKVVELIGKFEKVLLKGSATIKSSSDSKINNLSIYTMGIKNKVILDGVFQSVFVESSISALELNKGSYVQTLILYKGTTVLGDKTVGIGKVDNKSDNKSDIDSNIKVGKQPLTTGGVIISGGGSSVSTPKPNQEFQSKEFTLNIARGEDYVNGETSVELGIKLKDGIEAKNDFTVTVLDSNKNIVYVGQGRFVNGEVKLSTILKKGKYEVKINPSSNLETVVTGFEI